MTPSIASQTSQNTLIRLATSADLAAIVHIYNLYTNPELLITADLSPVSVEERVEWFNHHTPDNYPIWVLEAPSNNENPILGWVSLSPYYPRPAYSISSEISVYLHPTTRGKGYGKRLVSYALEQAPDLGIYNVLAVLYANNQASQALFASLGFEPWGHLPGVTWVNQQCQDIAILGKSLPMPEHIHSEV